MIIRNGCWSIKDRGEMHEGFIVTKNTDAVDGRCDAGRTDRID